MSVKGTWVPRHLRMELQPAHVSALRGLLEAVVADEGFPLNEMEDEVVSGLLHAMEDDEESSFTR